MPIVFIFLYFIVEAYVLFLVASKIGFLVTLLLLVLAVLVGSTLVRSQGLDIFKRANAALMQGESPQVEIVEGTILLICGIILIIPGFVTDVLVLPLLIPALRRRVAKRMLARLSAQRRNRDQYNYDSDGFVETRSSSYTAYTNTSSPFVFYQFFISTPDVGEGPNRNSNYQNTYRPEIDNRQNVIDCTAELEDKEQNHDGEDSQNHDIDSGWKK